MTGVLIGEGGGRREEGRGKEKEREGRKWMCVSAWMKGFPTARAMRRSNIFTRKPLQKTHEQAVFQWAQVKGSVTYGLPVGKGKTLNPKPPKRLKLKWPGLSIVERTQQTTRRHVDLRSQLGWARVKGGFTALR